MKAMKALSNLKQNIRLAFENIQEIADIIKRFTQDDEKWRPLVYGRVKFLTGLSQIFIW